MCFPSFPKLYNGKYIPNFVPLKFTSQSTFSLLIALHLTNVDSCREGKTCPLSERIWSFFINVYYRCLSLGFRVLFLLIMLSRALVRSLGTHIPLVESWWQICGFNIAEKAFSCRCMTFGEIIRNYFHIWTSHCHFLTMHLSHFHVYYLFNSFWDTKCL